MNSSFYLIIAFAAGLIMGGGGVWLLAKARGVSEQAMADAFRALAADTLRANNESFLQLAETRLKQSEQVAVGALDRKVDVEDLLDVIFRDLCIGK